MSSDGKPGIVSVVSNLATVPRFEKFELSIDLSASYDNPFDPAQVDLNAEFVAPSGKTAAVAGFFYQGYRNRVESNEKARPLLDAVGSPCWKVRFAPAELGRYRYSLTLRNRFRGADEQVRWGPAEFQCVGSGNRGFLRVSPVSRRYFQFDDGSPFFAVGQNLQNDWPQYIHSRLLADAGCNAARVWTFCHWTWLEWTSMPEFPWAKEGDWLRSYAGSGRYNQRIAWIADHHLDQWARDGLRVMLCIGNGVSPGEMHKSGEDRYDFWESNPYNVANGGCVEEPKQFWTDPQARKLYQQKLRYLVARYGYSTGIWAWEFWNELSEATPEIVDWHKEMARYVRSIDPNRHLITTSTWQGEPARFAAVWDLEEMDFTQSHVYAPVSELRDRVEAHRARWQKPHLVGEGGGPAAAIGADNPQSPCPVDPDGIEFHNSLWGAAMAGAAGTTLPWHWRARIEPRNLFFHYHAIARFVEDVPWVGSEFRPFQLKAVPFTSPHDAPRFTPVMIVPLASGWGGKTGRSRFVIGPDGSVAHCDQFAKQLFGSGRKDWRNPPTFEANFPSPGRFAVHIAETSHGILEVSLDGQRVLRDASLNVARKEIQKDFVVDVPAGRHEIKLDNAGGDWINLGYLLVSNFRDTSQHSDLDVWGLRSDDLMLLWVHNRLSQWAFRAAGYAAEPADPAGVTIDGLRDGPYAIEWWDTSKGEVTRREERLCLAGRLFLGLPPVDSDLACKVKPVGRKTSGGGSSK